MTRFIAIDGEGDDRLQRVMPDGTTVQFQDYTVLCSSLGTHTSLVFPFDTTGYKERARIGSYEALMWLTNLAIANPDATFIGYGLSYDIAMILRDLTFTQWQSLHKHSRSLGKESFQPVNCGAFAFRYIPRKFLEIIRYKHHIDNDTLVFERDARRRRIVECHMTLWDTIGFFQGTFIKAVEEYGLPVEDIDFIRLMKSARGTFETLDTATIIRYSTRECQILVALMERLESFLVHPDIDIHLRKWGGAGYIASALLKKYEVTSHLADPPKEVLDASLVAFSGGRIELIRYGHATGPIYDYDINSCYPSAMVSLPSLAGGYWTHNSEWFVQYQLVVLRVKWSLWDPERRIYPFAYRDDNGSISYPSEGETWVWLPEFLAAMKHLYRYKGGTIDVLESYSFVSGQDRSGSISRPFDFIPLLAHKRLEWKAQFKATNKREGGQHLTIKLGLNALYGKLVQQVGGQIDETIKLPPFHSMVYGGNVTSYGRAALYDAAMQNEDHILMFATDGLFTTAPLHLPIGKDLGLWEETTVDELIIVQSGVYMYRIGDTWYKKTRGFMPESITLDSCLTGWKTSQQTLTLSTKRFVTFGMLALATRQATQTTSMTRFCTWETKSRELSLTSFGTKRYNRLNDEYQTKRNASYGLLSTYPRLNETPNRLSRAYEYLYLKKWDELTEEQQDYLLEREGAESERE